MGIFSSKSQKPRKPGGKTIIAEGCKINGEILDLAGDLHVDGSVEGVIHTEFDISVGTHGKISGLVKAQQIAVSGVVEGKIACERVDVLAGGKLLGNVICNEMMIEVGGKFIGESREMTEGGLIVGFPELDAFTQQPEKPSEPNKTFELAEEVATENAEESKQESKKEKN